MRPTDLKFRHPSEKTPDPYDSFITSTGSSLLQRNRRNKSSFATAKRFLQAGDDKTSFWRGPGSYDLTYGSIGKKKLKGGPAYRPFHNNKETSNNSYFYIGNCLVFEPNISLMNKKKKREDFVENSFISRSRPTTASSRNCSAVKKLVQSPYEDSPMRPKSSLDCNFIN